MFSVKELQVVKAMCKRQNAFLKELAETISGVDTCNAELEVSGINAKCSEMIRDIERKEKVGNEKVVGDHSGPRRIEETPGKE